MIGKSIEVKSEESFFYLLEKHNRIGLLLKYNRIVGEIDEEKTENYFICICLDSKSI